MKHQIKPQENRGFSLVEMLVVIAVIGIISAIAVPTMGNINDKANTAKAKRNAQTIAALFNESRGVGAIYASTDTSGIIDELIAGKTGPQLAGSSFVMAGLSEEEKTVAMGYVSYDSDTDLMNYYPEGGVVEEVVVAGWWGAWEPGAQYTGGFLPVPHGLTEQQTLENLAEVQAAYPDVIFAHQYYYGNWQINHYVP